MARTHRQKDNALDLMGDRIASLKGRILDLEHDLSESLIEQARLELELVEQKKINSELLEELKKARRPESVGTVWSRERDYTKGA
jgi:hypothetical protein